MNIQRINAANIAGIYKKNQNESHSVKTNKAAAKDDLVLSDSGKIFNLALKAVNDAPEVRKDKVAKVSEQIKADNYKISSDAIADRIIKGAGFDKSI